MGGAEPPRVPEATPGRFAAGVGFQTLGRAGHAAAALGTLIVLTRILPTSAVGVYASYLSLYALLDAGVDAGSGLTLLRRASAEPGRLRSVLRSALRFRAGSALVFAVAGILFAALDPRVGVANLWGWLAAATLFSHLGGLFGTLFHVRLRFAFPSLVRAGGSLAALAGVLLLAAGGSRDPMAFLAVTLAGRVAANLALWAGAQRLLRDYPAPFAGGEGGRFARESLTLGLGGILREAYGRLDVLLLRLLAGAESAGLYAPVRQTLSLALVLPSYILTVAMPPLSASAGADPVRFRKRVRRLAGRLLLFAGPAALATLPLVPWYLGTFFEQDYAAGAPALRILALAAVLAYPGMVFLTALIAAGRAGRALCISAAALGANLALNLALIPGQQGSGAAWARVAAEAVVLGISVLWLGSRREGDGLPLRRKKLLSGDGRQLPG
ncbi:MAG: lipopolysaccharide biosynthesis protein, partial [Planctomycetota bacterium]